MPEVWGPVQIVVQCYDWTEDLSDLRDLSRVGARAVITPGATLSGPSDQLILGEKAG